MEKIIYIDFPNLNLNFDNNYFNTVVIKYNNNFYNFHVLYNEKKDEIMLYEEGKMCLKAEANKILEHKDFEFKLENLNTIEPLNINNIFKLYRLGIIKNDR